MRSFERLMDLGVCFAPETLTGARAQRKLPPQGHGWASQLVPIWGSYTIAANVEDGDIFEMCLTPDRYLLLGGEFHAADLDTGTEAMDMDLGWAANGAGSVNYTSPWGTVYANAAATASPTGLLNMGVLSGDAVTDIIVGQIWRPLVLPTPLFFTKSTLIQVEANAAANAGGTGAMTFHGWGVII